LCGLYFLQAIFLVFSCLFIIMGPASDRSSFDAGPISSQDQLECAGQPTLLVADEQASAQSAVIARAIFEVVPAENTHVRIARIHEYVVAAHPLGLRIVSSFRCSSDL
jgi:hypothetical protein